MKDEHSGGCGQQRNGIQGIMCHMKRGLCIYGYRVSMVTWICSYCNCDSQCLLSCAEYQRWSEQFLTLKGHFCLLLGEKRRACSAVVSVEEQKSFSP